MKPELGSLDAGCSSKPPLADIRSMWLTEQVGRQSQKVDEAPVHLICGIAYRLRSGRD